VSSPRLPWRRPAPGPAPEPALLPAGTIDTPADGSTISRPVTVVTGWAMFASGPADRVELSLNGRSLGRARLCELRDDVGAAIGIEAAALSGFRLELDLWAIDDLGDQAEIAGRAFGRDGETIELAPVTVNVSADTATESITARAPTAPARRTRGRMELLVATHQLNYGGAELLLSELLTQLAAHHGATGLVLSPFDGPTRPLLEQAGFEVHLTGPIPVDSATVYEHRLEELITWLRPRSFDAALINTFVASAAGDVATRLGVPAVWAIHESVAPRGHWPMFNPTAGTHVRERGNAALRAAAVAVFEAEATRRLYAPELPDVPCLTLPYGVDVHALRRWRDGFDRGDARRERAIRAQTTVVLCMGTFVARKAQAPLVRAFARVAGSDPDMLLLLVGSTGPESERPIRAAIAASGVEDRVRIEPVLDDALTAYGVADLLVCASDWESLPRSILEAMALGLPVLATNVFGIPELIDDGVTGWLCGASDISELAGGLQRVLGLHRSEREEVARSAQATVASGHDAVVCSARWAELLEAAAAGQRIGAAAPA
jgi:D-inositol-3-phosphate glycosyltransferase